MEYEARRFARRVILIHLALLVLVLAGVAAAGWVMYRNARALAIDQALKTQELLSRQTALGIQNYYESVTGVLNLLQPEGATPPPRPRPPMNRQARSEEAERGPLAAATVVGRRIWTSIREKSSLLFI